MITAGETFETEIVADTRDGEIDELSVLIEYPKAVLNPLALDYSALLDRAEDTITYATDPDEGLLYLHAKLRAPAKFVSRAVATIAWEALKPADLAELRFAFSGSQTTGLYLSGRNVLGTQGGAGDGVLHSNVYVRNPKNKLLVQQVGHKGAIVTTSKDDPPVPSMRLRLSDYPESVRAGEEFSVDVSLENPRMAPLDRIRLYVQFDPDCLEVVDRDLGAWIRDGININDARAHAQFPFDFHRRNDANNKTGEIIYESARELDAIRASGFVARIWLRAKRAAQRTDIVLAASSPGVNPTSDVTLLQRSVIRDRPRQAAALDGVALQVLSPEPGTEEPAVAAAKADNTKRGIKLKLSLSGISIVDKPAMSSFERKDQ